MAFALESPYSGTSADNQPPCMKTFTTTWDTFWGEYTEVDYFMMLCLFMCYDYFADGSTLPHFANRSFVMHARDDFGAAMPAARFIELYASGIGAEDSIDRFRLRRETRNSGISDFMERFHK